MMSIVNYNTNEEEGGDDGDGDGDGKWREQIHQSYCCSSLVVVVVGTGYMWRGSSSGSCEQNKHVIFSSEVQGYTRTIFFCCRCGGEEGGGRHRLRVYV